jgi:hypothetical protein
MSAYRELPIDQCRVRQFSTPTLSWPLFGPNKALHTNWSGPLVGPTGGSVSQCDARERSGAPIDPVFEFSEIGHHDRTGALPGSQYKVGEIFSTHLFLSVRLNPTAGGGNWVDSWVG